MVFVFGVLGLRVWGVELGFIFYDYRYKVLVFRVLCIGV